jgi:predicted amidohydrolase
MTCYDLRFPELARRLALQGIDVLVLPAAWLHGVLKEDHFRTLVRARAIENTVYVAAADQVGGPYSGNTILVDPMGVVRIDAGERAEVIVGEVDAERLVEVRGKLPCLANRRPDVYASWDAALIASS